MTFSKKFTIFAIVFCSFGFFFQVTMGNFGWALVQAALVLFNMWSYLRYHID